MIVKIIIISIFLLFAPTVCMELTPHNSSVRPQQTKAEWTPIFVAIFNQKKQDVKQLIKNGADINECSGFSKKTPLHEAVIFSYDITKTLLKHGAYANAVDIYQQTPLHICINFFATEKTIELLIHHNADVNIQDHRGKTALHKAVKNSDMKKINLLLANNANVSITTNKEKTALDYAQKTTTNNEYIPLIIAALENKIQTKTIEQVLL